METDEKGNAVFEPDGKPYFEAMLLSKQEAATVNIPAGEMSNRPGTNVSQVPVLLRALAPEEES